MSKTMSRARIITLHILVTEEAASATVYDALNETLREMQVGYPEGFVHDWAFAENGTEPYLLNEDYEEGEFTLAMPEYKAIDPPPYVTRTGKELL